MVHASALVDRQVRLGEENEVGPFCRLEGRVSTGERCRFGVGVVIGSAPMDVKYRGEETEVTIGSDNVFCEYVTVNRATGEGCATVVGSGNLIMAYVHVGHNCRVGDGCVLTNGVQLGGHVRVGSRANLGGLCGVHQFCRIGELAMVGACSYVNKDIPPFLLAAGNPCRVRGVNRVGMERAGLGAEAMRSMRRVYATVYRSRLDLGRALSAVETELLPGARSGQGREQVETFLEFCRGSRRGVELRSGGR